MSAPWFQAHSNGFTVTADADDFSRAWTSAALIPLHAFLELSMTEEPDPTALAIAEAWAPDPAPPVALPAPPEPLEPPEQPVIRPAASSAAPAVVSVALRIGTSVVVGTPVDRGA